MSRPIFHPVWVANSGRVSLRWGPPCASLGEAKRAGVAELAAGRATLAFVVREDADGTRTALASCVKPEWAAKIVLHWEALLNRVEQGEAKEDESYRP